ncbi:carbon storage regulator CsrA [Paenibacillus macerans]|uniref:Translational regulator CsrA n=1 Tax=Paenibacillus macerans TaxID=44252 RepID=A0A6N8EY06_PAEMA|nr:carbon storage regulator CsrA [Paenibacillus macerans]MUG23693.1 carbon storage regulator CsrA [Paenibacillus macerans]
MLVLSRKKGETVVIQDEIEITVLGVEGDVVRLGISAPRNVEIFRKEIYLSIQEANRESTAVTAIGINELLKHYKKND